MVSAGFAKHNPLSSSHDGICVIVIKFEELNSLLESLSAYVSLGALSLAVRGLIRR